MKYLLILLSMISLYSCAQTPEFESPFKNTVQEAVQDCDTVYQHLDSLYYDYDIDKIEEWDNGYILYGYENDHGEFIVYYYDAVDDQRIDIVKP